MTVPPADHAAPATLSPADLTDDSLNAEDFVNDLGAFVTAGPSSYHAAAESARRLTEAGFRELDETLPWDSVAGRHYVVRDGAVIAWIAPETASAGTPFTVLGAHTDSPGFVVKPQPSFTAYGYRQVGVEIYGGMLVNSWLDRELALAGRVATRDGEVRLVRTGPILRIPQLCIHLDRGVNDGLRLDRQRHTQPVMGLETATGGETRSDDLLEHLAELAGVDAADISGLGLITVDAQQPRIFGLDRELFASGRMDNLSSTHSLVTALIAAAADRAAGSGESSIALVVANDHEEVGSATRSGAAGPFLEDVLVRINAALGGTSADLRRTLAASLTVSADAGHGIHPNYPEHHDPRVRPVLGGGPLLKINASQRYASDAPGEAAWAAACERAGVPYQEFVSNNAMPCGSTIGPITATRLGMRTVDVGLPLLSMHSAREMCAVADPIRLHKAARVLLSGQA